VSEIYIAIKSYKRAGLVTTNKIFPTASIWVPESQAKEYRTEYGDSVVSIPDECDGNLCRKSNAILDRSPCEWTLILDDDITSIHRFDYGKDRSLDQDECMDLVKHGFDMASQLGVKLWGINQNSDEMAYASFRPFNLLAPVLGPFNGHLSPELRYDPQVLGKDDYDFWLQNIQKYHRTFRMNKYHYIHDHGKKPGGFVSMRTNETEQKGVERMIEKWGNKVFKVGGSPGARRDRKVNKDGNILNSMVRVPIDGC
jgi:hypothetical protein